MAARSQPGPGHAWQAAESPGLVEVVVLAECAKCGQCLVYEVILMLF